MRNGEQLDLALVCFAHLNLGDLVEVEVELNARGRNVLKGADIVMEQIKHHQVGELEGGGSDTGYAGIHELQLGVELVEKLAIADVLGHAVLDDELIQVQVVLAPLLH